MDRFRQLPAGTADRHDRARLILFDGGLSAGWGEIRPVLRSALRLAVAGTIVTALIAGSAAAWLFDFSLLEGLLLGAILAATDSAAVFALLRGTRLPTRLSRTLEGEAGFNDPVAVLLLLVVIELIQTPHYDASDAAVFLVQQVGVGVAVGVGAGWLAIAATGRHAQLPTSLPLVASFATAAISYGAAGALGGSGFVAVYLTGLALGSAPLRHRPAVLAFHEGLAPVAEIGMFLTLGLLVFPSQLGDVAFEGILLALITAVVARPLAVAPDNLERGVQPARARTARLGRTARRRPRHPRHLPGDPPRAGQPRVLQHHLLRRAPVGSHPRPYDPDARIEARDLGAAVRTSRRRSLAPRPTRHDGRHVPDLAGT